MPNALRRVGTPALKLAVFTFVALVLVAVVVSMSNARSGTIHYSVGGGSKATTSGGQTVPYVYNCITSGVRCRSASHTRNSRGRGTVVLSAELAIGLVLAAGTAVFFFMARRGRVSQESSSAFEAEPLSSPRIRRRPANAREAILAAFADLEDRLSGLGFTREPWEAAESYLARAMPDAWRDGRAAHILARLYALARYSHHSIDSATATQAITASSELVAALDRSPTP
jgi:hypothetical protein